MAIRSRYKQTGTSKETVLPDNGITSVKPSKMILGELGVVAKDIIEAGQLIFKITGPILQKPTKYTFQVAEDKHLNPQDEEGKPSFGHFTNHSCNPSAFIKIISHDGDGEINVTARRKIEPGEEVTVDYAAMEYNPVATGITCECESNNCRGIITGYKDLSSDAKKLYTSEGIISSYLINMDGKVDKI